MSQRQFPRRWQQPGVVVQRPDGSAAAYREHSRLPTAESLGAPMPPGEGRRNKQKTAATPRKTLPRGTRGLNAAQRLLAKEREPRESERRKEEEAAAKELEARGRKNRAALQKAAPEHERRAEDIREAREALDAARPRRTNAGKSSENASKLTCAMQRHIAEEHKGYGAINR